MKRGARFVDITGQRFGRLTVLSEAGRDRHGSVTWHCKCDCGAELTVVGLSLRFGHTSSCGCFRLERASQANIRHGHARIGKVTPTFVSWASMISRCSDPNQTVYPDYGGRGIRVCERWLKFENFLADMGDRPPGRTLDRKDNNGNYEPGNCRWATRIEQARNKRPPGRKSARRRPRAVASTTAFTDVSAALGDFGGGAK